MEYSLWDNIGLYYDKDKKRCIFLDRLMSFYFLEIDYKLNYDWDTVIFAIKLEIEWYINYAVLKRQLPEFNHFIFDKIRTKTTLHYKPVNPEKSLISFD